MWRSIGVGATCGWTCGAGDVADEGGVGATGVGSGGIGTM